VSPEFNNNSDGAFWVMSDQDYQDFRNFLPTPPISSHNIDVFVERRFVLQKSRRGNHDAERRATKFRFEKVGDGWTHDRIDRLSDIHVRVGRNWTRNVGCLLTPAEELKQEAMP